MKWALLAAGVLVVLIAIVAMVGAMLPERHSATRKARYRQTAEALYAAIAGPPDWRTDVKGYGVLPDRNGRKQWWEQDRHGQKVVFELVEEAPPLRRVVRIASPDLPFGGTWTLEFAPVIGGADLRVREDGEIHNVFFRFLARFFFGYTSTMETFLRDLGAKFGEVVTVES